MRVLVTRPARSGARTAKKLVALGHRPLLLPLTRAAHDPEAAGIALAGSTGALAVTSGEAIQALHGLGQALENHLARPLFAVGRATADEAVENGFTQVLHGSGDGADLADFIAAHPAFLGDQPLTYLAGLPRASGFETQLRTHGIRFESAECYRMEPVEPSEDDLQRFIDEYPADAVLFYSRQTAERFFSLDFVARHATRLENTRLLCLSATIATIVPYALRPQTRIAPRPDEDSLLGLLDTDESPILI